MSSYKFQNLIKDFHEKYDICIEPCKVYLKRNDEWMYNTSKNNDKKQLLHPSGFMNKDISKYDIQQIIKEVDINKCCMGYYRTGQKNNITVVDVDVPSKYHSKTNIKDVKLHDQIMKLLNEQDTLTIQTPSGGYHYIFEYTNEIKNKNNDAFNGNIDRLNDGGNLYIGRRMDGWYKIINDSKPKPLSKELINIFKTETKRVSQEKPDKFFEIKNPKYNHCDGVDMMIDTKVLKKCLKTLKEEADYIDGKGWHIISGVLNKYQNQIPGIIHMWDEWSKSGSKYDRDKNLKLWNSWTTKNEWNMNINIIIAYTNRVLFKNNKQLIKNFKRKIEYKPLSQTPHHIYHQKYFSNCGIDIMNNNVGHSHMGTGKSYNELKMTKENNMQLICINALKTINTFHANDIGEIFGHENVYVINSDVKNRKSLRNLYQKYNNKTHIITTVDSVYKLIQSPYENISLDINYDNTKIFLDEIHSTILHLYKSSTLNGKRVGVLDSIIKLIRRSSVDMLDGNITDVDLMFMKLCKGDDYVFTQNTYSIFKDVPMYIDTWETLTNSIKECFKNKQPLMITSNSLRKLNEMKPWINDLKKEFEINDKEVKYITSIDDKYNGTSEEIEDVSCLCISPSVQGGLDHQKDVIVFSIVEHGNSLTPEQVRQQQSRARKVKELHLYMNDFDNEDLVADNFEDFKKHYKENYIDTFKEICSKTALNGEYQYEENVHTDILFRLEYETNVQCSNFQHNLVKMCKNSGFKIIKDYTGIYEVECKDKSKVECPDGINEKQLKDNLKITQEISNDKFDGMIDNYLQREYDDYGNAIANDKFEENVLSVLDILLQNCNQLQYMNAWKQNNDKRYDIFKSLALSSSKFINHMNMSKLLRTNDNLFERIKNMQNKDLHEINVKTVECQLIAVREYFKKHLSMIYINDDLTTLNYDSTCEYNNKSVEITDAEYKYLKTMVRTTKKKPTNVKQAFDFGYLVLRKFVGYDNIHIVENTKRQNKKVVSTKKVCFKNIDNHIEIIKYRTKDGSTNYLDNVRDTVDKHNEQSLNFELPVQKLIVEENRKYENEVKRMIDYMYNVYIKNSTSINDKIKDKIERLYHAEQYEEIETDDDDNDSDDDDEEEVICVSSSKNIKKIEDFYKDINICRSKISQHSRELLDIIAVSFS